MADSKTLNKILERMIRLGATEADQKLMKDAIKAIERANAQSNAQIGEGQQKLKQLLKEMADQADTFSKDYVKEEKTCCKLSCSVLKP